MSRRFLSLAGVLVVAVVATSSAFGAPSAPRPVPSLTPVKTAKLWRQLVRTPRLHRLSTAECVPLRAVFYAPTDWLRLATKLAANASPCADYYVSVPPLTADKSQPRADQAWRIRALGPQFHALAEINVTGWSGWVSANGSTWYEAGREARRRMAASGYDVSLGDTWVVNEFSSAVRQGAGNARANMRDFVRGLYEGDGTPVRGAVFISGMSQATGELSVYQSRVQDWYEDAPFWNDMAAYVSDWSQELYGDVRTWAVAGADQVTRATALDRYLRHQDALARVAPSSAATAAAFLADAYNPLANAAWAYDAAFGWTDIGYDLMQSYVSSQVDALRRAGAGRFGFAWSPKNLHALPSADFTAQTDAILDRLAAAVAAVDPCADAWCGGDVAGAAFNDGWGTFATWKPSVLAFASPPQVVAAGASSSALTVELRTNTGVPYPAGLPVVVTLSTSSPGGGFATTAAGPWSPTLTVSIASGVSTVSLYYRDTQPGTAVVTASASGKAAGTQVETVTEVDATPPETAIVSSPTGAVASTSASVAFSSEPGARFQCSLDGAAFANCVSPSLQSGLSQGAHAFDVRAVDAAGNVDPSPAEATWTVDTIAPDTRITQWSRLSAGAARFWFAATEPATFQCSLDGGAWSGCTSPRTYTGLPRGRHTARVRAIDAAANVDATPAALTVKV